MSDATQTQPDVQLVSFETMKVARYILATRFKTPGGRLGLFSWRGDYYAWSEGMWALRTVDWLRGQVWMATENLVLIQHTANGTGTTRYQPTKAKITDLLDAVESLIAAPFDSLPRWHGTEHPEADPRMCIAFRDRVVDVEASAKVGTIVSYPRDEVFLGHNILTVNLDEEAKCPTWESCMEMWSGGDKAWIECRERCYGYSLMASRKYAKWLLEFGKVRGGKGTGTNSVLGKLLPRPAYLGTLMDDIADPFGLDGVESASVLVISEANDVDQRQGERIATLLKVMLGGDECMVNVKHKRQMKGIKLPCFPIIQSNQMLNLPNKGRGISSKMVAINFERSFEGAEDFNLDRKLEAELPGIALRLVLAAIRLEAEPDPTKKFPMNTASLDVVKRFDMENNPFDAFLESRFTKQPNHKGWVHGELMRKNRTEWEVNAGVILKHKDGHRVSDQMLLRTLEERSTWNLKRARMGGVDGGGPRGLSGLVLKAHFDDVKEVERG